METTTADKHQRLPDLMEGTIIDGTFEILRKLGAGGMGGVYLVRDNTLGRTFALKTIAGVPRGVEMEVAYERFAREAKLAARLRHPAIVPVYHYGTDAANGVTYYTMEDYLLTAGEVEHVCRDFLQSSPPAEWPSDGNPYPLTLADVLAGDRALGERAAVRIALDILPALEAAHDFDPPIVHRDLKPSNLIFGKDGMLRLSDFGIARPLPEETGDAVDDGIHDSTFAALTLPDGPVPGTPSYAAPELAAGATPTPAADYFSFGLLLYRILTGGLPTRGRTMLPTETLQSVSPLWQPLLDRLLDENPDTRLADPAQAGEAIEAIREAVAPRPRAPRRWLVAAIAASTAAALAGGLALLARVAHGPSPTAPSGGTDTAESPAVSWHVDAANGSDTASGLAWGTAKRSIQAAIDAASPGDCIIVTNGVYDAIATDNKEVTIESVNGARDTIIDGRGVRGCALLCHSDTGLSDHDHGTVLIGFTLRNGSTEGFGGIYGGVARNCIIENCKRIDNGTIGGRLGSGARESRLYNCLVRDNAFCGVAYSSVYNCTIVDNGMYGCWDSHAYNSIVAGHVHAFPFMSDPDRHPNCIEYDPKFMDSENGDYNLADNSPCIDSGDNSYVEGDVDLDGNSRVINGRVDIGAIERQSTPPVAKRPIPPTKTEANVGESEFTGFATNTALARINAEEFANASKEVAALYQSATSNCDAGRFSESLSDFQSALELEIASADANGIHGKFRRMQILYWMALAQMLSNRNNEAESSIKNAIGIGREMNEVDGDRYGIFLATTLDMYGHVLNTNGRHSAALLAFTEALENWRAAEDTWIDHFRLQKARTLCAIGAIEVGFKRLDNALAASTESAETIEPLCGDASKEKDPQALATYAAAQRNIGIVHDIRGHYDEAAHFFCRSFHAFEEFRKLAGNLQVKTQVDTGYCYANAYWQAGKGDEAISSLEEFADLLRDMMRTSPDPYYKANLKIVLGSYIQVCIKLGREDDARNCYEELEVLEN